MKLKTLLLLFLLGCTCPQCTRGPERKLSAAQQTVIKQEIQTEIDALIRAVSTKDIDLYMSQMPQDFIIYDESGEEITREQQREYALRDWSIIDSTLNNSMVIDSIDYASADSIFVYTFQTWERLMYQRDGVTLDTILTTQKHRELWKKRSDQWMGYNVEELGGEIFINAERYDPN